MKKNLDIIKEIISGKIADMALYCFGVKTNCHKFTSTLNPNANCDSESSHYYLLLFTEQPTNALYNELTSEIGSIEGITISLLFHKFTALKQHRGNQVRFFANVINNGDLVYSSTEYPILSNIIVPPRKPTALKLYWQRRKALAENLLDDQSAVSASGIGQVQAFLLHAATTQIMLGIIRTCLGYRPNQFALQHLVNLCNYVTPLATEIFTLDTRDGKRLFSVLESAPGQLNFGHEDPITDFEIEQLATQCNIFLIKATQFVENELSTHTIKP